jgi:hypothetical protein
MKKIVILAIVVAAVLVAFVACGPKGGVPVAGSATAEDMLAMFPKTSLGFVVVDINRAMQTEPANKMIADKDNNAQYLEFIKETGINPQQDVYLLAGAVMGDLQQPNPDGAVIVNARFNKDTLLAKLKEKGGEIKESVYEGITIYEIKEPPKAVAEEKIEGEEGQATTENETQEAVTEKPKTEAKPVYGAFLSDSNIALGTEGGVKSVIDVIKNKTENLFKNDKLADLIKQSKKDSMFWAAMAIPPEAAQKMTAGNPMLGSLDGIHSLLISFDYKNKAVLAEIKALTKDEAKNKQIAEFLTGLKALGGMASTEKPEVGELMNKIVITSGADFVSINADIPEELLNKLGEDAKKMMPKKEGPKEDIKN